jgi:hypothetical protein
MTRVAGVGAKVKHVQPGAGCSESRTSGSEWEVGKAISLSTPTPHSYNPRGASAYAQINLGIVAVVSQISIVLGFVPRVKPTTKFKNLARR